MLKNKIKYGRIKATLLPIRICLKKIPFHRWNDMKLIKIVVLPYVEKDIITVTYVLVYEPVHACYIRYRSEEIT